MYRVKSTDVWFNAPGIVAAYQPIAAPDSLAARYNVCNNARMAGKYTAVPGTAPTWSGATGWTFVNQYFKTDLVPAMNTTWSMFVRFDYSSGGFYPTVLGVRDGISGGQVQDFMISADDGASGTSNTNIVRNGQGNTGYVFSPRVEGIVGFAGLTAYHSGAARGAITSVACVSTRPLYIGCMNDRGIANYFFLGTMQCALVVARTLATTEAWSIARQMTYCHVNPDWNAWGRRRHYYYAPSATAAGRVGIYGRRSAVALPGGVRIGTVNDA